jgi:ubiquitin-protein ligase
MRLFVEDTGGQRFECNIADDTQLSTLAADFFEDRGWAPNGQRAVVELVDPTNPSRSKRLRGDLNAVAAALRDGDTLRIFPEAIAGAVDPRERVTALVSDFQELTELTEWNRNITFTANSETAPWRYTITFNLPGVKALAADGHTPILLHRHEVEIFLGAEYPRAAPWVQWKTPIFHPNIRESDGAVCLGVLMERYLPGLGLARLVTMLAEMVEYRNYDFTNPLNKAAAAWAADPAHWEAIIAMGGAPYAGPFEDLLRQLSDQFGGADQRERVQFTVAPREDRA